MTQWTDVVIKQTAEHAGCSIEIEPNGPGLFRASVKQSAPFAYAAMTLPTQEEARLVSIAVAELFAGMEVAA